MAKKWIQNAIKHKGALRRKAQKMGLLKGKSDTLSGSDLDQLAAHGSTATKRQVNLARTLKKLRK